MSKAFARAMKKEAKQRRQLVCAAPGCGKVWNGIDHFTTKGLIRKNLGKEHVPAVKNGELIREVAEGMRDRTSK